MRPPGPHRVRVRAPAHRTREGTAALGPALPRDRAILVHLARLRVLSLSDIHALVFAGRDRSRLSRRLTSLEAAGWLRRWEEPRERGGRFRFVVPTPTGLAWALRRLEEEAAGFAHPRLLATMLRTNRAAPVSLPPGRIPAFLPHLTQVNTALVALIGSSSLRVTWASSWPRPFPPGGVNGLRLPQPDGVLVLVPSEAPPRLVFLEHDRSTESLRSFARTKVDRYRALASRPGLLEELTGFRQFTVVVTVAGTSEAETNKRLVALSRLVRVRFAASLVTVCRHGNLLADPSASLSPLVPGVPPAPREDAASRPVS